MFKLTSDKVIRKIDRLLVDLSAIDKRIKDHEATAELAAQLKISQSGDDWAIREWRAAHDEVEANLRDASFAIRYGKEDFNEINKILPSVKESIKHFDRVLTESERLEAAGRITAHARFGNRP